MTDSKNNPPNLDLDESDNAATIYTTPKTTKRTSDIYERFLNRVQQIDDDSQLEFTDNEDLTSFEILTQEELSFFSDDSEHTLNDDKNDHDFDLDFDFNHSETISLEATEHTDHQEISFEVAQQEDHHSVIQNIDQEKLQNEPDNTQNPVVPPYIEENEEKIDEHQDFPQSETTNSDTINNAERALLALKKKDSHKDRPMSRTKLVVIGMVCGLTLSLILLFALSYSGLLATLTDSSAEPLTNRTDEMVINDNTVTDDNSDKVDVGSQAKTSLDDSPNDNDIQSADTSIDMTPDSAPKTAPLASNTPPITPSGDGNNRQDNSSDTADNKPIANAPITYDDFAEEANTTLYRDSKD